MIDKEQQIEEMARDICKSCQTRLTPTMKCNRNSCAMSEVVAENLCNIGYHKTVWHKVADGDLPEYAGRYLVILDDESLPEYRVDSYEHYWDGPRWEYNGSRVIAWAELLPYKGN